MTLPSTIATSAPRTARERVRTELTREIKDVARWHLAEHGSAGLSLRAVARDLGMVSSAIYRYFPSRDDLLTALIIDAFDAVGVAVEEAERRVARADLLGRWVAAAQAVRSWAIEHPHEYALVFGSPVPGYQAPTDTVGPATRVPAVLMTILRDGLEAGVIDPAAGLPVPRKARAALAPMRLFAAGIPDAVLARGVLAWTQLFGLVSFELFGHLHNVIDGYAVFFEHEVVRSALTLGLAPAR